MNYGEFMNPWMDLAFSAMEFVVAMTAIVVTLKLLGILINFLLNKYDDYEYRHKKNKLKNRKYKVQRRV